MQTLIRGYRIC
jgi:EPSP synthase (3-phosphoshikimate 1-carboxyvinyltransferase)